MPDSTNEVEQFVDRALGNGRWHADRGESESAVMWTNYASALRDALAQQDQETGQCSTCGLTIPLRGDGSLENHRAPEQLSGVCFGAYKEPARQDQESSGVGEGAGSVECDGCEKPKAGCVAVGEEVLCAACILLRVHEHEKDQARHRAADEYAAQLAKELGVDWPANEWPGGIYVYREHEGGSLLFSLKPPTEAFGFRKYIDAVANTEKWAGELPGGCRIAPRDVDAALAKDGISVLGPATPTQHEQPEVVQPEDDGVAALNHDLARGQQETSAQHEQPQCDIEHEPECPASGWGSDGECDCQPPEHVGADEDAELAEADMAAGYETLEPEGEHVGAEDWPRELLICRLDDFAGTGEERFDVVRVGHGRDLPERRYVPADGEGDGS